MKFGPRNATTDSNNEIAGQNWSLTVTKSMSDGPWYPESQEHSDDAGYRFFAGRLTRRTAGEALPSGFMLGRSASEWTFDEGEPDGSWIGLKFDRRNDEVSIACDRWVHQRWFYAHHKGAWYFSNSLRFLRQVAGRDIGIERRAIPYILLFGHLPGRITPLTNVSVVLPGEVISVAGGQMGSQRRTRIPVQRAMTGQRPQDISPQVFQESAEGILRHIQQAVSDELSGIDEVVVPLSGGMDSRFLLGCALDVLPRDKIVAYTFGDPRTMDYQFASGLARKLGVNHVPVAMDRRPVDEVCADGFAHTEGMAPVFPNSPLGADRKKLLKPGTYVLSGYLGDCVFGSHDVHDRDPAHNMSDFMFKMAFRHASGQYPKEAFPLLASNEWDELGYENEVRATPGETLAEKYERWHYEIHCVARVQYHLFLFRNRAFYLTPFVHKRAWDYSLTLPEAVRRDQRGYFLAMKLGYPLLHEHPTSRNSGFPAKVKNRTLKRMYKAWRLSVNKLDDVIWKSTGQSIYFDPKQLYGSRRELRQPAYHSAVADCIQYLKTTPALDPKGLEELHTRYRKRLPVSTHILRALFTVRELERQYG
jgi:hypothetical protein